MPTFVIHGYTNKIRIKYSIIGNNHNNNSIALLQKLNNNKCFTILYNIFFLAFQRTRYLTCLFLNRTETFFTQLFVIDIIVILCSDRLLSLFRFQWNY